MHAEWRLGWLSAAARHCLAALLNGRFSQVAFSECGYLSKKKEDRRRWRRNTEKPYCSGSGPAGQYYYGAAI